MERRRGNTAGVPSRPKAGDVNFNKGNRVVGLEAGVPWSFWSSRTYGFLMLFAVGGSEGAHFLLVDGSNITTDTRPEPRKEQPGSGPPRAPRGTGGAGCRNLSHTIVHLFTHSLSK